VIGAILGFIVGFAVVGDKLGSGVGLDVVGALVGFIVSFTVGATVGWAVVGAGVSLIDGVAASCDEEAKVGEVVGVMGMEVWQPSTPAFNHETSPYVDICRSGPLRTVYRFQSSNVTPPQPGSDSQSI
jgi:hypothetical protein